MIETIVSEGTLLLKQYPGWTVTQTSLRDSPFTLVFLRKNG